MINSLTLSIVFNVSLVSVMQEEDVEDLKKKNMVKLEGWKGKGEMIKSQSQNIILK